MLLKARVEKCSENRPKEAPRLVLRGMGQTPQIHARKKEFRLDHRDVAVWVQSMNQKQLSKASRTIGGK